MISFKWHLFGDSAVSLIDILFMFLKQGTFKCCSLLYVCFVYYMVLKIILFGSFKILNYVDACWFGDVVLIWNLL